MLNKEISEEKKRSLLYNLPFVKENYPRRKFVVERKW